MASTLFIIQFALAIILTILVLLQKSSSMGLGAYSGSNDSVFGAKGPANFLTKATFIISTLFVINTISLGYTYNQERLSSAVDTVKVDSLIPTAPDTK
jgi:preprotein translocase subunit SecG